MTMDHWGGGGVNLADCTAEVLCVDIHFISFGQGRFGGGGGGGGGINVWGGLGGRWAGF